jgi:hypothetical protein
MIPAGIYNINEAEDEDTFKLLHIFSSYENEKDNYSSQVKNGIAIGNGFYIRSFPVWFSFRGNLAVNMSSAAAAKIIGRYFNDKVLIDIANEQLYWTAGKNPFCQSFIYGEGRRYSQQYAILPGEMTGEMPVGIQTKDNGDEPFWTQANNATYKEVWTSSAVRWLMTLL